MGMIKNYNENLEGWVSGSGAILITGAEIDYLIAAGLMDSETVPSIRLLEIQNTISEQLHQTWDADPYFWDAQMRRLGGGIFVSNIWKTVE